MRLLNTSTYLLEEFFEDAIPLYAILSHRWEAEEVIFQDYDPLHGFTNSRNKQGWSKVEGSCKQSVEDGYDWVWIDTCCIDKSSSAELSEAINSMFNWYKLADICYAYLSDVGDIAGSATVSTLLEEGDFVKSKWFRRGWTLQELLAPEVLVFFDRSWRRLGEKLELEQLVKDASGIEELEHYDIASIAQKMSWAAKRQTTRIEDRAYSLMGIFGINMPPIYGEGERAFLRLQLEIIKISDDESIFAWQNECGELTSHGMLANSPNAFRLSGGVRPFLSDEIDRTFAMTNKGLRFKSSLLKLPLNNQQNFDALAMLDETRCVLPLCCTETEGAGKQGRVGVMLNRGKGDIYSRVYAWHYLVFDRNELQNLQSFPGSDVGPTTIYVKQFYEKKSPARGPYTFTARIRSDVRQRFKSPGLEDVYVSDSAIGSWGFSDDGEILLKTLALPATGIKAALILREKDSKEGTAESSTQVKLFIVIQIYKDRLDYCSVLCASTRTDDDGAVVSQLWKRGYERRYADLTLVRNSGPYVRFVGGCNYRGSADETFDIIIGMAPLKGFTRNREPETFLLAGGPAKNKEPENADGV